MGRALIFGQGGHAGVIASLIDGRYDSVVFVTKDGEGDGLDEEVFFAEVDAYRDADVFLGIGSNAVRRQLFERLVAVGIRPATCVSSFAFVAPNAKLGDGVVLCPGAVVMNGAEIGDNVIVNTHSSVDHDCKVGAHSQITAGVTFGGGVVVGTSCFFGIRSAVIPRVRIGDNAVIMAGSIVTRDVDADLVVGGYPATVIRRNVDPT